MTKLQTWVVKVSEAGSFRLQRGVLAAAASVAAYDGGGVGTN